MGKSLKILYFSRSGWFGRHLLFLLTTKLGSVLEAACLIPASCGAVMRGSGPCAAAVPQLCQPGGDQSDLLHPAQALAGRRFFLRAARDVADNELFNGRATVLVLHCSSLLLTATGWQVLTNHWCLGDPGEIIAWIYHTFDNNLEIKDCFPKYLKESCW